MPLDAPPPIGPPPSMGPPPPLAPPPPDPTQVGALSDMAGMDAGGMDMIGTLRMAAEFLSKAAQMAQGMGDMGTATQLAQAVNMVTTVAQAQLQGPMAGPMAGNGMGGPPPSGPSPATMPGMRGPTQAQPVMMPG